MIPDGNRRWATSRGLLPWNGHQKAVENFQSIVEWCQGHPDISVLTLWCFSTENWKRSPKEVSKLMELFETYLKDQRDHLLKKRTRLLHSGRTDRMPPSLRQLLQEIAEESAQDSVFTLHLAIDYGGRDEVVRAVRKLANTADATEESLRAHLDHPELPDIDLVIRTSGEMRTSNFALWQSAYAEWFFVNKYFPELTVEDIQENIQEYRERKRRFGT